jgi:hypothetical protein
LGIHQSREELAKDVLSFIVTTQLFQRIPAMYHPKGLEPPISSKHKYKVTYESENQVSATFGDYANQVSIDFDIAGFTKAVAANKYILPEYFLDYVKRQTHL